MDEGSFDDAINGCQGVFHTASPVLKPSSNPKACLINQLLPCKHAFIYKLIYHACMISITNMHVRTGWNHRASSQWYPKCATFMPKKSISEACGSHLFFFYCENKIWFWFQNTSWRVILELCWPLRVTSGVVY